MGYLEFDRVVVPLDIYQQPLVFVAHLKGILWGGRLYRKFLNSLLGLGGTDGTKSFNCDIIQRLFYSTME